MLNKIFLTASVMALTAMTTVYADDETSIKEDDIVMAQEQNDNDKDQDPSILLASTEGDVQPSDESCPMLAQNDNDEDQNPPALLASTEGDVQPADEGSPLFA